jgi:hypothetical protein
MKCWVAKVYFIAIFLVVRYWSFLFLLYYVHSLNMGSLSFFLNILMGFRSFDAPFEYRANKEITVLFQFCIVGTVVCPIVLEEFDDLKIGFQHFMLGAELELMNSSCCPPLFIFPEMID